MKTPDHRYYDEKREIKLVAEPYAWEELGKVIVCMSLIILGFIGLGVFVVCRLI